jgi:anaerobic selenocysteine-containing dehydrogenase
VGGIRRGDGQFRAQPTLLQQAIRPAGQARPDWQLICQVAAQHMDARELSDDDFPLVLNTGRLQHQWQTMTKTGKLNKLNSGPFVEIHPVDAAGRGRPRASTGSETPAAA